MKESENIVYMIFWGRPSTTPPREISGVYPSHLSPTPDTLLPMRTPHQERIEQFMRLAGQEIPQKPTIPSDEVRLLRAKLILEEALETIKALGVGVYGDFAYHDGSFCLTDGEELEFSADEEPDLVDIADGCADISVVTIGTLSACGIHDQPLLEEVDRSNLAKFKGPKCDAVGCGVEMNPGPSGWWYCPEDSKHYVKPQHQGPYRRADGKWIKPPYWQAPKIKEVLEAQ